MKRYLISFAYDATNYHGYQKQPNLKTVQSEIERALFEINNNKKSSFILLVELIKGYMH